MAVTSRSCSDLTAKIFAVCIERHHEIARLWARFRWIMSRSSAQIAFIALFQRACAASTANKSERREEGRRSFFLPANLRLREVKIARVSADTELTCRDKLADYKSSRSFRNFLIAYHPSFSQIVIWGESNRIRFANPLNRINWSLADYELLFFLFLFSFKKNLFCLLKRRNYEIRFNNNSLLKLKKFPRYLFERGNYQVSVSLAVIP